MSIITVSNNIAESSVVTLTAGTAHSDFPLARVYNRNITDLFKTTAAVTTEIQLDQGASGNIEIQSCIIAAGHNLSGETIDIQHSVDAAAWIDAVTQFTGADGHIVKVFAEPLTKRYWRLKITSPAAAVEIPEVFFSPIYTWETDPVYPLADLQDEFNIQKLTTKAGENLYLQRGPARKTRKYLLKNISEAQKNNLVTLWADWAGYKPFFITDHEAELFYAEIIGTLNLRAAIKGRWDADIELREVLGI